MARKNVKLRKPRERRLASCTLPLMASMAALVMPRPPRVYGVVRSDAAARRPYRYFDKSARRVGHAPHICRVRRLDRDGQAKLRA